MMNYTIIISTIFMARTVTSVFPEYLWHTTDSAKLPYEPELKCGHPRYGGVHYGCEEEKTSSFNDEFITWASTPNNNYALSNPRCLDENKRFIRRKCKDLCWEPAQAPVCNEMQNNDESLFRCSEGFQMFGGYCVLITNPSVWSDICFKAGSDINIFQKYNDVIEELTNYLYNKGIQKFWLPAKKFETFGPFLWNLVGQRWKEMVNVSVEEMIKSNMCLSFEFEFSACCSTLMIEYKAEDCSLELPIVCIESSEVLPLSCPEGYYTTTSTNKQHSCYGVRTTVPSSWTEIFAANNDALIINDARVNRIVEYIMKTSSASVLWLALRKTNDGFRWINGSEVQYVNWDVTEDYSQSYGAMRSNGTWNLQPNTRSLDSYASVLENIVQRPEIILKFYPNVQRLELTVYSPKSFFNIDNNIGVSCFTDAGMLLQDRVDIKPIWKSDWPSTHNESLNYTSVPSKVIYRVVLQDYPGNYWCEGVMLKTLDIIRSEMLFAYKKYYSHIYSFLTHIPTNVLLNFQDFIHVQSEVRMIRMQKILNVSEGRALTIVQAILEEPDVLPNSKDIIKYYKKVKQVVNEINSENDINLHIISMNSTLYCIPEDNELDDSNLTWDVADLGTRITPSQLCLQENGLPVYRSCVGDTIFGAAWQKPIGSCDSSITPSETTRKLFDLSRLSVQNISCTDCVMNEVHDIITNTNTTLIPADIYYIGVIFDTISKLSSLNRKFDNRQNVSDIISHISGLNETMVKLSQIHLNSTNKITDSIQRLLEVIPKQDSILNNTENGLIIVRSPKFVYQISNPAITNISGLALIRRNNSLPGNLDDYDITSVSLDTDLIELLKVKNIEVSIWLPQELLQRIEETSHQSNDNLTIIVSIYNDDIFFKENRTDAFADRVISISMPGYGPNIPVPFAMLFRQSHRALNLTNTSDSTCSYWNYHPRIENALGKWYSDGCTNTMTYETGDGKIIVCACSHLTNFGQLITGSSKSGLDNEEYEKHGKVLDIITLTGCSLSIFGLLGIFVMAIIFKSWRRKTGTKVLLHLSLAIAIEMIIIFLFNINVIKLSDDVLNPGFNTEKISCIITGVLLHYSVLASFCWMIIIAFMQYLRYVRVLGVIRPMNFVTKSACIAWGCPLMPVLLILLIDPDSYVPESDFEEALCYPSGLSLIIGVILPVAIIVFINLVIYTMVLLSIIRKPKENSKNSDSKLLSAQLRLSLFLFSLLGLTWLFGLADAVIGDIIFSYLFSVTATLQGFILFIYFVIIDPATRSLWKCCGKPVSMNSTTMQ